MKRGGIRAAFHPGEVRQNLENLQQAPDSLYLLCPDAGMPSSLISLKARTLDNALHGTAPAMTESYGRLLRLPVAAIPIVPGDSLRFPHGVLRCLSKQNRCAIVHLRMLCSAIRSPFAIPIDCRAKREDPHLSGSMRRLKTRMSFF
jgi:hypothetical protein